MYFQPIIGIIAGVAGFILAILVGSLQRFGSKSWALAFFLVPSSLAVLIQGFSIHWMSASEDRGVEASFALLMIAAVGGFSFISTFSSEKNPRVLKKQKLTCLILSMVAILLICLLYFIEHRGSSDSEGLEQILPLGFIGYLSALFLLVVAVNVLAKLEWVLRGSEEGIRWEIKFLMLGIALSFAAMIYISSKVLLYAPNLGLLSAKPLALYAPVFLISCFLIAFSWRRSSGRTLAVVSHRLIYSSITLLGVGIYLIASSLLARQAGVLIYWGLPLEAFFFLFSVLILAIALLGTSFRHRARNWIRRYLLAGRYDYRQFWLEATERVQSVNAPTVSATALADIVYRALGAIDISVWIRLWNPNKLRLLATLGAITETVGSEESAVVEEMLTLTTPVSLADLKGKPNIEATMGFLKRTNTSLLVPLVSGDRLAGIITVGSDRGGSPYGWEAREFLLVLGGHAAGEFHKSDLMTTLVAAKEDEAFRAFSTFVLHDLKNFASTLSLIAQNAVKFQDNPEFQKDAFHSIYETAEKMKRLCNSLRSFSSSIASNKKLEDLNRIVRTVVDKELAGLSEKLHLELPPVPLIPLDAEEVTRVLHNLVLNAQQAISSEGSIWIRTAARDGIVELTVADNGKGMSRQFLENGLFLPFHTTKSDGLGIGLFHTQRIIKAHGGNIRVESAEGKGTTIKMEFPGSARESETVVE